MKMTDVATNFPPQTYSSSFFLNSLDEGDDVKNKKTHKIDDETTNSSNLLDCFLSKMLRPIKLFVPSIFILLYLSSSITPIVMECIDTHKTRTFDSLVEFQNNNINFDPLTKNQGNYVRLLPQVISTLPRNAFISFESKYIWQLSLDSLQIARINDGAFLSLTCLHVLDLHNNIIEELSKNIFTQLWHLHELNLGRNHLTEIPEQVFEYLPLLKTLNLTQNYLSVLHPDSFYNLTSLETLDLSYNFFQHIGAKTFQHLVTLNNLQLGSNLLDDLEAEKWTSLKRLTILNASNNVLLSFDLSYDFAFNTSLQKLYLNQNYLTKFNSIVLTNMLPALKFIDIGDNPWLCSDLQRICTNLTNLKIKFIKGSDSEPEVFGIACNRSIEAYKRNKVKPRDKPKAEAKVEVLPTKAASFSPSYVVSSDISTSINNMYTFLICFFTLFVLYVVFDIIVRTGYLNTIISRRRRHHNLDNESADNLSILGERL